MVEKEPNFVQEVMERVTRREEREQRRRLQRTHFSFCPKKKLRRLRRAIKREYGG